MIGMTQKKVDLSMSKHPQVDLQKRTVELGAVSSLLTACYDAVVELDQNLKLTQDPCLFVWCLQIEIWLVVWNMFLFFP